MDLPIKGIIHSDWGDKTYSLTEYKEQLERLVLPPHNFTHTTTRIQEHYSQHQHTIKERWEQRDSMKIGCITWFDRSDFILIKLHITKMN